MKTANLAAGAAAMALCAGIAHADPNLITNGSFETGDFTGWSLTDSSDLTYVAPSPFYDSYSDLIAEDGQYFAALGASGTTGTLSQTFSDVAGVWYKLSFYVTSDGAGPNHFAVTGPGGLDLPSMDIPGTGYTQYSAGFEGTGSDTITFKFRDDPGFIALDNVSASTPEPAVWAILGLGFFASGAALRRRRAAAAV